MWFVSFELLKLLDTVCGTPRTYGFPFLKNFIRNLVKEKFQSVLACTFLLAIDVKENAIVAGELCDDFSNRCVIQ